MVFVDHTYLTIARKSEATFHNKKVTELERTIKQLTEALVREHHQHRSRLMELERLEGSISPQSKKFSTQHQAQLTLKPLPSSQQKWSQIRKYQRHHVEAPILTKAG